MSIRRKTDAQKFLEELTGEKLTFGKMIKSLRLSDQVSQAELARRMGKGRQYINDVENFRTAVSPAMAAMFALVMGYSIPMFVGKALEEQLEKEGLPLKVNLKPSVGDFEKEVINELLVNQQFKKSPRNLVLNLLESKKTPPKKAKSLVNKYVNDDGIKSFKI